jgi:sterol desaturase/sphingolipid hydroxylase (fatty acid hydroxylase superfamily)
MPAFSLLSAAAVEPTLIDKIGQHMINGLTFDLMRYFVAAGFFFALILIFKGFAAKRKVQKRNPTKKDYVREIASSIRSAFVFGVTTISTILLTEAGIIHIQLEEIATWALIAQIAVMILAHDAYFYWMHRTLHHKKLFRATHLHHHKSRTPSAWAAYSFSTWEAMTEAAFVPIFLLITSLLGVAYAGFAIFIFLWFMIVRNVMGHLGVELHPAGWVDTPWLDWINTTTHHDLHHSSGNHNFGLYFTWWDRMMGTEHPQYKERFREVAQPVALPKSPSLKSAEKAAVATMALFAASALLPSWLVAIESGLA